MEKPIKHGMIWGENPLFLETPICWDLFPPPSLFRGYDDLVILRWFQWFMSFVDLGGSQVFFLSILVQVPLNAGFNCSSRNHGLCGKLPWSKGNSWWRDPFFTEAWSWGQLPHLTGNIYWFQWQQGYQAWKMRPVNGKASWKDVGLNLNPWSCGPFLEDRMGIFPQPIFVTTLWDLPSRKPKKNIPYFPKKAPFEVDDFPFPFWWDMVGFLGDGVETTDGWSCEARARFAARFCPGNPVGSQKRWSEIGWSLWTIHFFCPGKPCQSFWCPKMVDFSEKNTWVKESWNVWMFYM